MKKTYGLLYIMVILFSFNVYSQDKIYLKNGEKIEAKIIKVTEEKIEYKKFNNLNGPVFEISVDKTQLVIYENGESQILSDEKQRNENDSFNKFNKRNRINLDLIAIGINGPTSISYEILNKTGSLGFEIPINVHFNSDGISGITSGLNMKFYVSKKGKGFYFGPSIGLGVFNWTYKYYGGNGYYYNGNKTDFSVYLGPKIGGQFQISNLVGFNLSANGGLISNFGSFDFGASLNLGINFTF